MEQRTDEWLSTRKGKFTGSEIHKLMTEPKSKSEIFSETSKTYILEKIAEEYLDELPESFTTTAMQFGIDNEPLAKKWYSKLTGKTIDEIAFVEHPQLNDCGGSPDGYVRDGNHIIEIKCPFNSVNHIKHILTIEDNFKKELKEYYWQMQFYIECLNVEYCDFISFNPRMNNDLGLHVKRINRNQNDIDFMNQRISDALDYKENIKSKLISEIQTQKNW